VQTSQRRASYVRAFVEILLLSTWIGAMAFFSFAVAPAAFAVLPSRHLAGLMVANTLVRVEWLGLVTGSVLVVIQLLTWRSRSDRTRLAVIGLLAVMLVVIAMSLFWISPTMESLRAAMGGVIDDVPVTDPLRVRFNELHQYSVTLMSVALAAGLADLFLIVRSRVRR
jgi:hypothetical protein